MAAKKKPAKRKPTKRKRKPKAKPATEAPSNLTRKVVAAIESEIESGAGFYDAVRIHGVTARTAARWRKVGMQDRESGKITTLRARLSIAADRVEGTRTSEARKAVATCIKDSKGTRPDLSLKASQWYLERKEREEFGAQLRIQVEEGLKDRIRFARQRMSRGAYLEMIKAFAEHDGIDIDESGDLLHPGNSLGEGGTSDGSGRLH